VKEVAHLDKTLSLDLIKFVKGEAVIDANGNYQEVSRKNLKADPLVRRMLWVCAFRPALISEKIGTRYDKLDAPRTSQ
jgi:hypothetical protein